MTDGGTHTAGKNDRWGGWGGGGEEGEKKEEGSECGLRRVKR
jgi:hypothetical protein